MSLSEIISDALVFKLKLKYKADIKNEFRFFSFNTNHN